MAKLQTAMAMGFEKLTATAVQLDCSGVAQLPRGQARELARKATEEEGVFALPTCRPSRAGKSPELNVAARRDQCRSRSLVASSRPASLSLSGARRRVLCESCSWRFVSFAVSSAVASALSSSSRALLCLAAVEPHAALNGAARRGTMSLALVGRVFPTGLALAL